MQKEVGFSFENINKLHPSYFNEPYLEFHFDCNQFH